ncbi:MAG: class I SAM-dependent methyltransferase [Nitrospirota bacterium]
MNLTRLRGTIAFWDYFAPWYEKWISRGTYHMPIVREISQMIDPGCRILDIGAGTGPIAIPLASMGCIVRALEPSSGMRDFLSAKLLSFGIENIKIVPERWEDFTIHQEDEFDLVVACNSLHLTSGGIAEGMKKVFSLGAFYVALVTEINQNIFIDFKHINTLQNAYNYLFIRKYHVDSSFYFESPEEVLELKDALGVEMICTAMRDGRPVQCDSTDIAIVFWERK